jgi:hypothetical protein
VIHRHFFSPKALLTTSAVRQDYIWNFVLNCIEVVRDMGHSSGQSSGSSSGSMSLPNLPNVFP